MTAVVSEPTTVLQATAFHAITSRDDLESAIKFITTGLVARPSVPVLGGVLIEAHASGVTVSAFDFTIATRQHLSGFGEGRVLVNARMLKDMVAKLAKGSDVTLVVIDGKLEVRAGNRTYRLPLLLIEDYPSVPQPEPAVAVFEAADVARLLNVTVAAGVDDTLPALTCVQFDFDSQRRTVVAAGTDRYRLAVLTVDTPTTHTGAVLVQAKFVAFMVKHLAKQGEVVTVGLSQPDPSGISLMSFTAGDRQVILRTESGDFPQVMSLFPSDYAATLDIQAKALLDSVDGAKVVLPRNCALRISMDITGATVHAGAGYDAESSEFVGGTYEGESMTIAFSPEWLVDGVKAVGTETVRVRLTNAAKPAVFTSTENGTGFRYLLMPVRLSN